MTRTDKFSAMSVVMLAAAALLGNAWLLFHAGLFAIWAWESYGERTRLVGKTGDGLG